MPAPTDPQAFTLDAYFNSTTQTDPAETPTLANGILLPSNWGSSGMGVKAWRREWRAQLPPGNPGNPFWNPGLRILKAKASSGLNSNYFAANNDTLGINAWDLQGPSENPAVSTVTNASVQVTAYYYNASGVQTFIDPSTIFAKYCWGLYNLQSLVSFPKPASGNCSSLSQAAANPVPTIQIGYVPGSIAGGNHFQAGPNTLQQMNVGGLATLLFVSQILPPVPPPGNATLKIQIAIFLTLRPASGPAVFTYDDPEMDVDCT
jgi:hypothetical protein